VAIQLSVGGQNPQLSQPSGLIANAPTVRKMAMPMSLSSNG